MEVNIEVEKASSHKPSLINRRTVVDHGVVVRTWVGPRRACRIVYLHSLHGADEVSIEDGELDNCLVTKHLTRGFCEDCVSFYMRVKQAVTFCRIETVKSYGKKHPVIYC